MSEEPNKVLIAEREKLKQQLLEMEAMRDKMNEEIDSLQVKYSPEKERDYPADAAITLVERRRKLIENKAITPANIRERLNIEKMLDEMGVDYK